MTLEVEGISEAKIVEDTFKYVFYKMKHADKKITLALSSDQLH